MRPPVLTFVLCLVTLVIAACGGDREGDDEPRLEGRTAAKGSETLVAALGDSITAGSPAWDPDPAVREPLGTLP